MSEQIDDVAADDGPTFFEADWVRVVEVVGDDGVPTLLLEHSDMMTPWKMLGLLQAALEFQKTMTTNLFYGATYEEMLVGGDDDEDWDPDDPPFTAP